MSSFSLHQDLMGKPNLLRSLLSLCSLLRTDLRLHVRCHVLWPQLRGPNGAERWQVSPLRCVTGVTWCLYITGQIFWKENGEPYSLQLQRTLENKTRYGFLVGKLSEGQMRPCFQFAKMLSKQILITMSHLNSSIMNSSTNIPFAKCGFFSKLIHSLSKTTH